MLSMAPDDMAPVRSPLTTPGAGAPVPLVVDALDVLAVLPPFPLDPQAANVTATTAPITPTLRPDERGPLVDFIGVLPSMGIGRCTFRTLHIQDAATSGRSTFRR
jgi:hypothetical protein